MKEYGKSRYPIEVSIIHEALKFMKALGGRGQRKYSIESVIDNGRCTVSITQISHSAKSQYYNARADYADNQMSFPENYNTDDRFRKYMTRKFSQKRKAQ